MRPFPLALFAAQEGAATLAQLRRVGTSWAAVDAQLTAGRWQRPLPGVYVGFTGPLPAATRRWVAVLYAGRGAALSHATAAHLWGLRTAAASDPIHVAIPAERTIRGRGGLIIHRCRRLATSVHPAIAPRRTTLEATVFDLAADAVRLDDALALVATACQLRRTTGTRLHAELARRPTQRWHAALVEAVRDAVTGAHSLLEVHYLRDVERAHGLPTARRQRHVDGSIQDAFYDEFAVVVELDGRRGHADAASHWRDMARDNRASMRGETTLRFGWAEVTARPCEVAAQVAEVLRRCGWSGVPKQCGASCRL